MEALRIKKRLDSDTLHITGLKGLANKDVEVIILVDSDGQQGESPFSAKLPKRTPGSARGLITIADDFHEPLDEKAAEEFYK